MSTLDVHHLQNIQVHENMDKKKPFMFIAEFVKNNQAMTSFDFKTTHQVITDELNSLGINYAILMFAHGTYVFTETKVKLDKIMFKLANGINFNGNVKDVKDILNQVNQYLERDKT